jgi:hypothetical protein
LSDHFSLHYSSYHFIARQHQPSSCRNHVLTIKTTKSVAAALAALVAGVILLTMKAVLRPPNHLSYNNRRKENP